MDGLDFLPEQLHILKESEQIKAYIHPTRMLLLDLLAKEKRTVSGVAKELEVHPANITHHFKLLEKAGLIRLVEKRDIGKNLEKYYRAIAFHFIVRPGADAIANKSTLALSVLRDHLMIGIETSEKAGPKTVVALLEVAKLSPSDINMFIAQLNEVANKFKQCDQPSGVSYCINLSMYPNDTNADTSVEAQVLL
jgi:DNA-binding transcriptional ArsR family regulator